MATANSSARAQMEDITRKPSTRGVSPSTSDASLRLWRARPGGAVAIAHDLRTPLSVIQFAAARLLQETDFDKETVRRNMETILRSVAHATRLTEELEECADEENDVAIRPARVHVPLLLDSVRSTTEMLAAQTSVAITIEDDQDLPLVWADVESIGRVLWNLIGNAAKFTPPGGRVIVRAYATAGEVRFSVADTGPGVREDDQVHMFEPFWRASSSDARSRGLGLSICRHIVEAQSGRLKASYGHDTCVAGVDRSANRGGVHGRLLARASPTPGG